MSRDDISIEEIKAKQAAEADSRLRQNYRDAEKQCVTTKSSPGTISSNLHRELQEKLSSKFSETTRELDRLHEIRRDLEDETVKRVLRVLSF